MCMREQTPEGLHQLWWSRCTSWQKKSQDIEFENNGCISSVSLGTSWEKTLWPKSILHFFKQRRQYMSEHFQIQPYYMYVPLENSSSFFELVLFCWISSDFAGLRVENNIKCRWDMTKRCDVELTNVLMPYIIAPFSFPLKHVTGRIFSICPEISLFGKI